MGKQLIRTMKAVQVEGFTRPRLSTNISRVLGVRYCVKGMEIDGQTYDIFTNESGMIVDIHRGLSVAPPPKENMRPHLLRLRNQEEYFFIDEEHLENHPDLVYLEDPVTEGETAKHGVIAPRRSMHIDTYISYLSGTQTFWEVLSEQTTSSENRTQSAIEQQLHAETKKLFNRPDR